MLNADYLWSRTPSQFTDLTSTPIGFNPSLKRKSSKRLFLVSVDTYYFPYLYTSYVRTVQRIYTHCSERMYALFNAHICIVQSICMHCSTHVYALFNAYVCIIQRICTHCSALLHLYQLAELKLRRCVVNSVEVFSINIRWLFIYTAANCTIYRFTISYILQVLAIV